MLRRIYNAQTIPHARVHGHLKCTAHSSIVRLMHAALNNEWFFALATMISPNKVNITSVLSASHKHCVMRLAALA